MLGLELLQLAEQTVVLGIRNLRLVACVVGLVRALDEPPQLGCPCGGALPRPLASSWITAIATPTKPASSSALARGNSPSPPSPSPPPHPPSNRRREDGNPTRPI